MTDVTLRILQEDVNTWKKTFPNLVAVWGLTDLEVVGLCAAEKMQFTFGSKPADWQVADRDANDEATMSWRATLPAAKMYPVVPKVGKKESKHAPRN